MHKKYLDKLSDLIIKRIEELNCTIEYFSEICGISYREMENIKNRTAKDIKFSTFAKLCENGGIAYIDIFGCKNCDIISREIQNFILTDGEREYKICQK